MEKSAQSTTAPGDKPFRFLDLPPELRNRIYGYIFTAHSQGDHGVWALISTRRRLDEIGHTFYRRHYELSADEEDRSVLAILQTCRQINKEARSMPFNINQIRFENAEELARVVAQMDCDQLAAVRSVEIQFKGSDSSETHSECEDWRWGMLKCIPNLQYLRLVDVVGIVVD